MKHFQPNKARWTALLLAALMLVGIGVTWGAAAQDIPTAQPPTPPPGQPQLVAQDYQVQPSPVRAGEPFSVIFTVTNIGNRTSLGGLVALDPTGKFLPGSSESVARLPDLTPGMSFVVALNGVVMSDTPTGPNLMTLQFDFTDFSAENYETSSTTTVQVINNPQSSQVTITGYQVTPNPLQPGRLAILTIQVTNSGTALASQALLRVNGGEGAVLLAGPSGDSFPLGDIAPGETKTLAAELVVASAAKAGPQPQALTITYLQGGEAKEATGNLTLTVARADLQEALILLDSYAVDKDPLAPGDTFTMSLSLTNTGKSDAQDLLVTFGTVTDPGDGGSGGGGGGSTTPSTTFAPLGTGGTVYVGSLTADGGSATLEQAFIVDGSVKSGVYGLPVTLRYIDLAGEVVTRSLTASVIVIQLPQLRFIDLSPVPLEVMTGQPVSVSLTAINDGANDVNLRTVQITAENGEVIEGAEQFIGTKKTNEEASINAMVMPLEEGPMTITVTINYIDALNQPRQIIREMEATAIFVEEPPIDPNFPPVDPFPTPEPTPEPEPDLLGRFLRGLLGLGS
ncbi:MAG: hypothetical protein MUF38_08795 [Anaerolineae bacterium]|jgi:hypothetical protein|nr:hypothetical protein [Anaerolineae bacterium]